MQIPNRASDNAIGEDVDSLPSDTPGLLSLSKLNQETVAYLTGATRFSAKRGRYVPNDPSRGFGRPKEFYDFSHRFSPVSANDSTPQEAPMARRLAALLLRDELWTGTPPYAPNFSPDFVFHFADALPGVLVSVCPNAHEIHMEWTKKSDIYPDYHRYDVLLFDPVAEEMTAFIKEAFPDDPDAQSLVFVPKPTSPSVPAPTRPPDVSPETWAKAATLRPGMTRADLLQCFEEEGGISTRYGRVYNMRRNGPQWGGLRVKIKAEFVPAGFPLLWRSGKGFLRHPEDRYKGGHHEMPDDIITFLSPLCLGYMNAD